MEIQIPQKEILSVQGPIDSALVPSSLQNFVKSTTKILSNYSTPPIILLQKSASLPQLPKRSYSPPPQPYQIGARVFSSSTVQETGKLSLANMPGPDASQVAKRRMNST
jgi:hypothetical protein